MLTAISTKQDSSFFGGHNFGALAQVGISGVPHLFSSASLLSVSPLLWLCAGSMGNLEIFDVLVCPCPDEEMVEGEGEANCGEQEGRRRVVGFCEKCGSRESCGSCLACCMASRVLGIYYGEGGLGI
jgi:hypothetical protein